MENQASFPCQQETFNNTFKKTHIFLPLWIHQISHKQEHSNLEGTKPRRMEMRIFIKACSI